MRDLTTPDPSPLAKLSALSAPSHAAISNTPQGGSPLQLRIEKISPLNQHTLVAGEPVRIQPQPLKAPLLAGSNYSGVFFALAVDPTNGGFKEIKTIVTQFPGKVAIREDFFVSIFFASFDIPTPRLHSLKPHSGAALVQGYSLQLPRTFWAKDAVVHPIQNAFFLVGETNLQRQYPGYVEGCTYSVDSNGAPSFKKLYEWGLPEAVERAVMSPNGKFLACFANTALYLLPMARKPQTASYITIPDVPYDSPIAWRGGDTELGVIVDKSFKLFNVSAGLPKERGEVQNLHEGDKSLTFFSNPNDQGGPPHSFVVIATRNGITAYKIEGVDNDKVTISNKYAVSGHHGAVSALSYSMNHLIVGDVSGTISSLNVSSWK